jgi:hypothetical protein
MLVKEKGTFIKGLLLFVSFFIVLALMFMPLFDGKNALETADNLYNAISKGSTYYIPGVMKKAETYKGTSISVALKMKDAKCAEFGAMILGKANAKVAASGTQLAVEGDLGAILLAALKDSDDLFNNKEDAVKQRYGAPGRRALHTWWTLLSETDKDLKRQKKFKEAKFVNEVITRGVEAGYNYFGIIPESAKSKALFLVFSLAFYVVYTLWWGVSVLLLFEGFGLQLKAGAKKEV